MYRTLIFLSAESPVHAGADASTGSVDLPIQRETASRYPVIWGQSLKGALRDHCRLSWPDDGLLQKVFGSDPPGASRTSDQPAGEAAVQTPVAPPKPGSLTVGDAQLVAFPTPTLTSTFAYVSSPLALSRTARKAALATALTPPATPGRPGDSTALACHASWTGTIVVGPFVMNGTVEPSVSPWASWLATTAYPKAEVHDYTRTKMVTDLLVVGDDLLGAVSVECVEITPRVQLDENKTVRHGPFYSEYLPTESLLAAVLECRSQGHLTRLHETFDGQVLQIGGDETIGKGLLWCRFAQSSPATGGRP